MVVMPRVHIKVAARPDEDLKPTLFNADRRMWTALQTLARKRNTSRSAMVRGMIRREVARARAAGEIA